GGSTSSITRRRRRRRRRRRMARCPGPPRSASLARGPQPSLHRRRRGSAKMQEGAAGQAAQVRAHRQPQQRLSALGRQQFLIH
ncbi:unnamed protein product, partial [Bubo scandiacus]